MRTVERLKKLKAWTFENTCRGKMLKAPVKNGDVTKTERQEPRVFLGFAPSRPDLTMIAEADPTNCAPSIIILPASAFAKNMEEQRFDRYSGIKRPKEMGQQFAAHVIFTVYEDGVKMPGFIETYEKTGALDMTLIREGTEEGLFTLLNWMDDFIEALLGAKSIPGTDLIVNEADTVYGLRSDQRYIMDKRPLYYGQIDVLFNCHADEVPNQEYKNLLD